MNTKLLLISIVIGGLSSCSTAYKTGQTPDDVYYSPTPPHNDYSGNDSNVNNSVQNNNNVYSEQPVYDREIRTIHNRRWRRYHDNDYGYYPYGYYPYGTKPAYIDPKTGAPAVTSQPRKFNLGTYKPTGTTTPASTSVFGSKVGDQPSSTPVRTFPKPANNGSTFGNLIRKVFTGSNSGYNSSSNNDNSTQSRTYESKTTNNSSNSNNGSSNSNKSSGSSSSSAPVRSFPK